VNYLKAKFGPRVSHTTMIKRLSVCLVCDKIEFTGTKAFCNGCGCPKWRDSELRVKLTMENAECPKNLW
jgi:hypothetical protein